MKNIDKSAIKRASCKLALQMTERERIIQIRKPSLVKSFVSTLIFCILNYAVAGILLYQGSLFGQEILHTTQIPRCHYIG